MDGNQIALIAITCPQCSGVLQKEADSSYHCPIGHVYTPRVLITKQTEEIEAVLWTALRVLEEQAKVLTMLVNDEQEANDLEQSYLIENSAALSRAYAAALRSLLASYALPL